MLKLNCLFVLFLLLISCSEKPTYDLIIGEQVYKMQIHEDNEQIQNEIISKIKPIWENFSNGESSEFYTRRILELDLGEVGENLKEKFGDSIQVSSTCTSSTPKSRFFKKRDGISGLEQVNDEDTSDLILGEDVRWNSIEYYLRTQIYDTQTIDRMIKQKDE